MINPQKSLVVFIGNGSTVSFPFSKSDLTIISKSDLYVKYIKSEGIEYDLNEGSDYTLTLSAIELSSDNYQYTGSITLTNIVPIIGSKIKIYRKSQITQNIAFHNHQGAMPKVIEKAFDKMTHILQEMEHRDVFDLNVNIDGQILKLTKPNDSINRFLGFNSTNVFGWHKIDSITIDKLSQVAKNSSNEDKSVFLDYVLSSSDLKTQFIEQILSSHEARKALSNFCFSVGELKWMSSSEVKNGFLLCDNRLISQEVYKDLFAVIKHDYKLSTDDESELNSSKMFRLPATPYGRVVGFAGSGAGLTVRKSGEFIGSEAYTIPEQKHSSSSVSISGWQPTGGAIYEISNHPSITHTLMQPTYFIGAKLHIYAGSKDATSDDLFQSKNGFTIISNGASPTRFVNKVKYKVLENDINITLPQNSVDGDEYVIINSVKSTHNIIISINTEIITLPPNKNLSFVFDEDCFVSFEF